MLGRVTEHCRFCGHDANPEELYSVAVPYLERELPACAPCRDDFCGGGRRLLPFEPGFRADLGWRWPAPGAADARAFAAALLPAEEVERLAAAGVREAHAAAEAWRASDARGEPAALARVLLAAIAGGEEPAPLAQLERLVDRTASDELEVLLGLHAHRLGAPPLDHEAKEPPALGEAAAGQVRLARRVYLMHAETAPRDERSARLLTASVLLDLATEPGRESAGKLDRAIRHAEREPGARDPRLLLAKALLFLREGNLAGVDRVLAQGIEWADASAGWAGEKAALLHDAYVRAAQGRAWARAKEALLAHVKLVPGDVRAHLDLAHTYMQASLDPVAREVLAAVLDEEAQRTVRAYHEANPDDDDGRLLYATCLARLGEPDRAWTLLRDHLEARAAATDDPGPVGAETRHLAGLCAHAVGKHDEALALLAESYAIEKTAACRRNLVTLVQERAVEMIEALDGPERFEELAAFVKAHGEALTDEYGRLGVHFFRQFIGWQLDARFGAASSFAPDDLDGALPGDQWIAYIQALTALGKRRLSDAMLADARARAAGGAPIPIRPLLAFLARLQTLSEEGVIRIVREVRPPDGEDGDQPGGEGPETS